MMSSSPQATMSQLFEILDSIRTIGNTSPSNRKLSSLCEEAESQLANMAVFLGHHEMGSAPEPGSVPQRACVFLHTLAAYLREVDDDIRACAIIAKELADFFKAPAAAVIFLDEDFNSVMVTGTSSHAVKIPQTEASRLYKGEPSPDAAEGIRINGTSSISIPFKFDAYELTSLVIDRPGMAFSDSEANTLRGITDFLEAFLLPRFSRNRANHKALKDNRLLQEREERLRVFIEESPDMIYTTNGNDIVASINAAGLKLLGEENLFGVVGFPFSQFALNPQDRSSFLARIRKDGVLTDFEIILKRKDGSEVFCLETARAVFDKEGRLKEIQGIVKDISERISRERELWKASMELAEVNSRLRETQMLVIQQEKLASIGHLAAGIAHEINNPLGFIMSNFGTLQKYLTTIAETWNTATADYPGIMVPIDEKARVSFFLADIADMVTDMNDGFYRIITIIKNLKNFARAEMDSSISPYDLNKGIESTLVVAQNEIKYVAEVELELGEIPSIDAAGGEINQVLLNIIVNASQAIESMHRQELGSIKIRTCALGQSVRCEISDDGPGVPEPIRHKIFDPFFSTKEPGKGTGLGLSISYDIIVKKHLGRLEVASSDSGGAKFIIDLPVRHGTDSPSIDVFTHGSSDPIGG